MIRRTLACGLIAFALPVAAEAVEVEFNVPVELRNIDGGATHVLVVCGSFGDGRFLNSARVEVPLSGEFSKSFSGVVKVVVPWPGTVTPSGSYRCSMAMRTAASLVDFDSRPSAVNTRSVTVVEGDFSELRAGSLENKVKQTPRLPAIPSPR
jgi:hypothetical protein